MTETKPRRAPVRLNEGVERRHLRLFYFSVFFAAGLMVYVSFSKAFLLSIFLNIPTAEQGRVAGNLQSFRELVILFAIAAGGILADRLGRRLIYTLGFYFLGLGFFLFPLARTVNQLLVFYVVSGVGAAFITAMLSTILADYVANEDRGRAGAVQGALGALSGLLLLPLFQSLPKLFGKAGFDPLAAGRISYYILTIICLGIGSALWFGLWQGGTQKAERRGFVELLGEGLAAARQPGVALSYAAAFVSRGDLAVVGLFIGLWANKIGAAQGLSPADVLQRTVPFFFVGALVQIMAAPFVGRLADRVNRAVALAVAALIGVVAYGLMFFVQNPLNTTFLPFMAILGVAQISGLITSQVLVAEQAPAAIRGSVIGFFGLCGAAAQILLAWVGGRIFDQLPAGPFLLVGGLNLLLLLLALALRDSVRPPANVGP
jgi:MFS family permease